MAIIILKTRLEGIWIRNLDTLAASRPPTPWDRFSCSSTQGEGGRLLFLVSIISAAKGKTRSLHSNFYEIHYVFMSKEYFRRLLYRTIPRSQKVPKGTENNPDSKQKRRRFLGPEVDISTTNFEGFEILLIRIRIRVLLLIKVNRICDHWSTNLSQLHFEPPSINVSVRALHGSILSLHKS